MQMNNLTTRPLDLWIKIYKPWEYFQSLIEASHPTLSFSEHDCLFFLMSSWMLWFLAAETFLKSTSLITWRLLSSILYRKHMHGFCVGHLLRQRSVWRCGGWGIRCFQTPQCATLQASTCVCWLCVLGAADTEYLSASHVCVNAAYVFPVDFQLGKSPQEFESWNCYILKFSLRMWWWEWDRERVSPNRGQGRVASYYRHPEKRTDG